MDMRTQQRTKADKGGHRGAGGGRPVAQRPDAKAVDTCSPVHWEGECGRPSAVGSPLCEAHLRGRVLAALMRRHWPRLSLSDGRRTPGEDDSWRPWLREATGADLSLVLQALGLWEAVLQERCQP